MSFAKWILKAIECYALSLAYTKKMGGPTTHFLFLSQFILFLLQNIICSYLKILYPEWNSDNWVQTLFGVYLNREDSITTLFGPVGFTRQFPYGIVRSSRGKLTSRETECVQTIRQKVSFFTSSDSLVLNLPVHELIQFRWRYVCKSCNLLNY